MSVCVHVEKKYIPYVKEKKRKEGKFPIKEKVKKKRKKIPNQRMGESKKGRKESS